MTETKVTQSSTASTSKPRRLVPVKEACAHARMGRTKLYEKINAKVFHAYRRDGRTMIDLNSIDDYHQTLQRIELG